VKMITGDWDETSRTCTNTCHDDSIW